ncbi:hypothetical protein D3P07_22140 [Paenibacillus sp. 1011MAR3C5]|uniref:hypothetical protein n=1 Tax=Paenibacillus sp. 1011MAR3C5 TaxID=1675787 RepID=UPI000E6C7398|nr:hypothetical protein [Paenibacillus sp. 1011MAR3C5]RJE84635.1 hypothetical protein D3P07_22140 [Paenibacillus sp. 1011MAR3C5]
MTKKQSDKQQQTFIFNVEIMVEDGHHAHALEKLIQGLNRSEWSDYRITSGIQLGSLIDQQLAEASGAAPVPIPAQASESAKATDDISAEQDGFGPIRTYMKSNTLIRLIVNRGLGIKLNIPCRIINMDERENLITVYHVDEKQVYTFRMNEIEDFIAG